jgi:hypothetical protein
MRRHWVRVEIQEYDPFKSRPPYRVFGRFPMTVTAGSPLCEWQQPDIALLAQPGARPIAAAAIDDDDLEIAVPCIFPDLFNQKACEEKSVAGDRDDSDRISAHTGFDKPGAGTAQ